jgi:hypothetical protein
MCSLSLSVQKEKLKVFCTEFKLQKWNATGLFGRQVKIYDKLKFG